MPILTEQIYTINKIREMAVSVEEKIRLLREIKLTVKSNCTACRGRIDSAQRLLNQMVDGEVTKLLSES